MARDRLALVIDQAGHVESELAQARRDLPHLRRAMDPRIGAIGIQPRDGPVLHLQIHRFLAMLAPHGPYNTVGLCPPFTISFQARQMTDDTDHRCKLLSARLAEAHVLLHDAQQRITALAEQGDEYPDTADLLQHLKHRRESLRDQIIDLEQRLSQLEGSMLH